MSVAHDRVRLLNHLRCLRDPGSRQIAHDAFEKPYVLTHYRCEFDKLTWRVWNDMASTRAAARQARKESKWGEEPSNKRARAHAEE